MGRQWARTAAQHAIALALLVALPGLHAAAGDPLTVLYLPLDERFTTRDAFLNLAQTTPYRVLTPPPSLLPARKTSPDLDQLHAWVDDNIARADVAVVSLELYLYGGLIASRCSNDTTDAVLQRLDRLLSFARARPSLRVYASAVVMRIPSYDGDVEEPWYWGLYGAELFTYSYYTDKYSHTHDATDKATADAAVQHVPPAIVSEFLWRRARNMNVTLAALDAMRVAPSPLSRLHVTLDDNAPYGFNIAEASRLKQAVDAWGLQNATLIYPGADEVALTLLARLASDAAPRRPRMRWVFRAPDSVQLVPNYEGQPMVDTLRDQITAAGADLVNGSDADITLLVNNFNEAPQQEAPNQPMAGRSVADYAMFDDALCGAAAQVIGFADNRYSNGADRVLVQYLLQRAPACARNISSFAYAGWNTNGNTLGTVIANTVLLAVSRPSAVPPPPTQSVSEPWLCPCSAGDAACANACFNALRLVEDCSYQADVRQMLVAYVSRVAADSVTSLDHDLPFYTRFSYKPLAATMDTVADAFGLSLRLTGLNYPWNRTFEIGLSAGWRA